MRPARGLPQILGIALVSLQSHAAHAQGSSQWIVDFEGEAGRYTVSSPGRPAETPVHPLQPLKAGDRIAFKDDRGWLLVHLGPEQDKLICIAGSVNKACDFRPVFTVPAEGVDHSFAGRMVSWVGSQFEQWFYGNPEAQRRETITTRDSPQITAAMLSKERQLLTAGVRTLCLKWNGASPPYHVEIRSSSKGSEAAVAFDVPTNSFCRPNIAIQSAATYDVTITSGARFVSYTAYGASAEDVPRFPSLDQQVPRELLPVLQSAWLASQEGGAWAWEAYLRLVPSCEMSRAATDLCRAMETGRLPKSPPQ